MNICNRCLAAFTLICATQASADVFPFDDFSSAPSLEKYTSPEETVQLDTTAENLVLRSSGRAYTWNHPYNWLVVDESENGALQMQADVTLLELELGNPDTQFANASICGAFYNAVADEPDNQLGDVFACIRVGDTGLGPQASWSVSESIADDFSSAEVQRGTFGTVELNTTYTLSMTWDGDNTFGFTFDNGATVMVDGPVKMGEASIRFRGIATRLHFAIDFGDSTEFTYSDAMEIPDDGSTATVVATVDNFVTEFGLIDDFSDPTLDQGNWDQFSTSTERVNGKLEMRATGAGERERERLFLKGREVTSLGADITLLSSSTVNNTTQIRGRVSLAIGNDTYDLSAGDTPNGREGTIWTQFLIERVGGVNQAVIWAERAADADWSTYEALFWMPLAIPIVLDQEYSVLVEKTGTLVEYFLDGQLVHSFDLASDYGDILSGNIYDVTYDEHASLTVRVDHDAGEARAQFDNIVTDHKPKPDITANGSEGPLQIPFGTPLQVDVSLASNPATGRAADWWLVAEAEAEAEAPNGRYWYDLSGSWVKSVSPIPTYGGALFDITSKTVLNSSNLPIGNYRFYFGVDTNANGVLDFDVLFVDTVDVTIQ
jgi:hypothetical protein